MSDTSAFRSPPSALSHLKVLDLSRVFAGPWCAQLLADLGADVIKVENPRGGDDVRHMGAALRDGEGADTGERASFVSMNRGKRSIAIDLATPGGQELVRRLAAQSDVLIENYRTGTLARYGLDYSTLRSVNPQLVYCSITGFGQTGPRSDQPGYDAIFQAMSGVMSVTGSADGLPGSEPSLIGYSASDINAGLYAAVAILAALVHRDAHSGEGQHIDLALLDAQVASMSHLVVNHLLSGRTPVRSGSASQINAPWKAFACHDRELMVTIGNDRQFRALVEVLGRSEVADDSRFATNASRLHHRAELYAILDPLFAAMTLDEASGRLAARGISCAPVYDVPEALSDPQVVHRGAVVEMHHPLAGTVPLLGNPIRLSETPVSYDLPPPLLDEHREWVLRTRLGLGDADIASLREQGAVL